MISQRINQVLNRIGINHIPEDPNIDLEKLGVDSLMLALFIIELEKEFSLSIPVIPLEKKNFESIKSVEGYLISLGAQ